MSSDGSASRAMRRELRAIELDAAREKEVRQRFEERIAEKKIKFERAKKKAEPSVERRDHFKQQLEEEHKEMERLQRALDTNKRGKKRIEDEIQKARQQMTDLDEHIRVVTRGSGPPQGFRPRGGPGLEMRRRGPGRSHGPVDGDCDETPRGRSPIL
jgi:hypothetical protein